MIRVTPECVICDVRNVNFVTGLTKSHWFSSYSSTTIAFFLVHACFVRTSVLLLVQFLNTDISQSGSTAFWCGGNFDDHLVANILPTLYQ